MKARDQKSGPDTARHYQYCPYKNVKIDIYLYYNNSILNRMGESNRTYSTQDSFVTYQETPDLEDPKAKDMGEQRKLYSVREVGSRIGDAPLGGSVTLQTLYLDTKRSGEYIEIERKASQAARSGSDKRLCLYIPSLRYVGRTRVDGDVAVTNQVFVGVRTKKEDVNAADADAFLANFNPTECSDYATDSVRTKAKVAAAPAAPVATAATAAARPPAPISEAISLTMPRDSSSSSTSTSKGVQLAAFSLVGGSKKSDAKKTDSSVPSAPTPGLGRGKKDD
jgi:hypothetical protein